MADEYESVTLQMREKVNAAMLRVVNDDVRMRIAAANIGMMPSELLALYVRFNSQEGLKSLRGSMPHWCAPDESAGSDK